MNIRKIALLGAAALAIGIAWRLLPHSQEPAAVAEHQAHGAEGQRAPSPGQGMAGMEGVGQAKDAHSGHADSGAPSAERKVLYWYDPMHPEQRFDKPGKSPYMDMDLLPKYASEGGGDDTIVEVDPRMAQNLGIRTATVTRGAILHSVDAVGAIEVDEHLIYAVESRAEGWVERLSVRAVGEPVKKGQVLAGVYSPDLYSAQAELVLAAKSGDPELIAASRQRLGLLGMSERQITQVQSSGQAQRQMLVVSPRSGAVIELNVREGEKVMPGTPLMRIADLSRVWITAEIPESLADAVSQGRRAQARLTGMPQKLFEGRVDYVYPNLDPTTRTVRARVVFDNANGALKPGMYGRMTLLASGQHQALLIPSESVIRTGKRTVVIVAEGPGSFRPAEVTLGPEHEGQTVVLSGLEEGQNVVASGQFLIDSEASLRGAYKRLEGGAPSGGMEGMAMPAPSEKKP